MQKSPPCLNCEALIMIERFCWKSVDLENKSFRLNQKQISNLSLAFYEEADFFIIPTKRKLFLFHAKGRLLMDHRSQRLLSFVHDLEILFFFLNILVKYKYALKKYSGAERGH